MATKAAGYSNLITVYFNSSVSEKDVTDRVSSDVKLGKSNKGKHKQAFQRSRGSFNAEVRGKSDITDWSVNVVHACFCTI